MLPDKLKPYTLESLNTDQPRRDQEFVPLLGHDAGQGAPSSPQVADCAAEADPRLVFEEAYREGEKAGFEMGMKKVEPLAERLNKYIAEVESFQRRVNEKAEMLAMELALAFAESIILRECDEHRDVLYRMIKKALECCGQKGNKTIRIRTEDRKFIEAQDTGWTVVSDESLREPGFVIETEFGDVDGRVSSQIEELRREFAGGTGPAPAMHPVEGEG